MKRTIVALVVVLVLIISAAVVYAATSPAEKCSSKAAAGVCPMTGDKVSGTAKTHGCCPSMNQTKDSCNPTDKSAMSKCPMHNTTKPAVKKAKVVSAVCPVMGSKIPDIRKAAGKSVYKGKTYYFCCAGCKPQFDKNPEKYIHKKAR